MLRRVVAALGLIVLARLLWDPSIMGAGVGRVPVFNWLLLGYGVPAAAFLAAGHILKRSSPGGLSVRICDALGVLFAGLLVFFEIRHALNGGDPLANASVGGLLAAMAAWAAAAILASSSGLPMSAVSAS